MAKAQVARAAAKKAKKAKQWYTVLAPPMFNAVPVAETLAEDAEKLRGRVAEATVQDLTGDFSKVHVKCYFKVSGFTGTSAQTRFVGHELTNDYIRRLTRRRHSKIDHVVDVTTRDGYVLRLKPMIVTERRAQTTKETAIRRRCTEVLQAAASATTMAELVRDVISGELGASVQQAGRAIYPLKRIEIRKSEVLKAPDGAPEAVVFNRPKAEAAPPPEAAPAEAGPEAAPAAAEPAPGEPAPEAPREPERAEEELAEEERLDEPEPPSSG